jgi:hypothetical protein
MKLVENHETIPAQPERVVTHYRWVAFDGKEFNSKLACERYEKRLQVEQHPVFASKIHYVPIDMEGHYGALYNLTSQEDYDFFKQNVGVLRWYLDEWDQYGPGWYLHYCENGGDVDYDCLYHYDEFEQERIKAIEEFCESIKFVREQINKANLPPTSMSVAKGE